MIPNIANGKPEQVTDPFAEHRTIIGAFQLVCFSSGWYGEVCIVFLFRGKQGGLQSLYNISSANAQRPDKM